MNIKSHKEIKDVVRKGYGKIAKQEKSCCSSVSCCSTTSCGQPSDLAGTISKHIGYTDSEMQSVPEGSNLGLGCGNPVAIASLKKGEIVLDLGSGAGFDAFLASKRVGKKGRVIGVDMTSEMINKAKENAKKGGYKNVEFRLGEIEKLPVEDNSIDVILSNCVINLSTDKKSVFKEAFRVLKSKGRLMVSDIVLIKELPADIKGSVEAYVGCIAGAIKKEEYLNFIKQAGFKNIEVISESNYPVDAMFETLKKVESYVSSIKVSAVKM